VGRRAYQYISSNYIGGSSYVVRNSGGFKDHNFLRSRVNRNMNYIFGILTSRAINWYINELILRGSGGGGAGGV